MIEAREGRTVREIWLADGEPAYRGLETKVLEEALALPDPAVVAAAGGVVLREENRRLLTRADVCTVRLVADPEVLVTRVGQQGHRPLLDDDPLAALRRLTQRARGALPRGGRRDRPDGRCADRGRDGRGAAGAGRL